MIVIYFIVVFIFIIFNILLPDILFRKKITDEIINSNPKTICYENTIFNVKSSNGKIYLEWVERKDGITDCSYIKEEDIIFHKCSSYDFYYKTNKCYMALIYLLSKRNHLDLV